MSVLIYEQPLVSHTFVNSKASVFPLTNAVPQTSFHTGMVPQKSVVPQTSLVRHTSLVPQNSLVVMTSVVPSTNVDPRQV